MNKIINRLILRNNPQGKKKTSVVNKNQSYKNQRGVALILVLFSVILIFYLVTELSYETSIEYAINANAVSRLKAYYAAKSGVDISLLRIKIYNKIRSQLGATVGANRYIDMIWSFPFSWPPIIPGEAGGGVEADLLQDKVKDSIMDASYRVDIFDEGSKIDLNNLNSKSKTLREITRKQVLNAIQEINKTPEGNPKYQDLQPDVLLNNIIDWMDLDKVGLNNNQESSYYNDLNPEIFPPNRWFRTLGEVRLVGGMTTEIFNAIANHFTIYGMKSINPNQASKEVLMSLHSSITEEVVTKIIERRNSDTLGGYFKKPQEFWEFVNSRGGNVPKDIVEQTPISCDQVSSFHIRSFGEFANQTRQIDAYVYDSIKVAADLSKSMRNQYNTEFNIAQDKKNSAGGKSEPKIVYWIEN